MYIHPTFLYLSIYVSISIYTMYIHVYTHTFTCPGPYLPRSLRRGHPPGRGWWYAPSSRRL